MAPQYATALGKNANCQTLASSDVPVNGFNPCLHNINPTRISQAELSSNSYCRALVIDDVDTPYRHIDRVAALGMRDSHLRRSIREHGEAVCIAVGKIKALRAAFACKADASRNAEEAHGRGFMSRVRQEDLSYQDVTARRLARRVALF